ncbi:MAG: redoxin domain-containing protein [Saprospiraceae bacterium]
MGKFKLTFLFFLILSGTAFGQKPDSTLIDVQIEGLSAGMARLIGTYGDQNVIVDSTQVGADGHFILRREHPLPAGFYTFLLPGQKNFALLFDQDQRCTLRAKLPDIVGTMQMTGSPNTDLLFQTFRFQTQQEPELKQLSEVMGKNPPNSPEFLQAKARQTQMLDARKAYLQGIYKANPTAFFTKFKIAGQNPDPVDFRKPNGDLDTLRQLIHYRTHFWDGVDFTDERLLHTPVIVNKLRRYIKELTPQKPDSIIVVADQIIDRVSPNREYFKLFANWIGLQYENTKTTVMDGEAVYVHVIRKYMTPERAFWSTPKEIEDLQKHVGEMEASLLGRKGMDVRAQNAAGQFKSIYEMTAPIIVIFMYSPDCEHCQKDAPKIEEIYEKWKTLGVDFYAIAVNTTDAEWREFEKKNHFTFTNVFDPTNRAIYGKYFVDITPELYVLNKDRIIVAKNLHADQLEEVFAREMMRQK